MCALLLSTLLFNMNQTEKTTLDLEQSLLAADKAFAQAVAARGIEGWMDYMADDAARVEKLGGKFIKGKELIRKADAPLFADAKRRLVWKPVDAHIHADKQSGLTSGRYQVVSLGADGKETVLSQGAYFTGWRKQPGGEWKVVFDAGSPDAPGAKSN